MTKSAARAIAALDIAITANTAETTHRTITNEISNNDIEVRQIIKGMTKIIRSHRSFLRSLANTAVRRSNNTRQQRAGYLFEDAHGRTLQTDMVIKGIPGKVEVPTSTKKRLC